MSRTITLPKFVKHDYLPTCTSRLVVQHLYQVSFKSMQGCRRSWEEKLWCDGRTEWRNDGRTDKANTKSPLAILWRGHKNESYLTPVRMCKDWATINLGVLRFFWLLFCEKECDYISTLGLLFLFKGIPNDG